MENGVFFSFIQIRTKYNNGQDLINSETVDNVYDFFNQLLRNQKKNFIITKLNQILSNNWPITNKAIILDISHKTINKQRNKRLYWEKQRFRKKD